MSEDGVLVSLFSCAPIIFWQSGNVGVAQIKGRSLDLRDMTKKRGLGHHTQTPLMVGRGSCQIRTWKREGCRLSYSEKGEAGFAKGVA